MPEPDLSSDQAKERPDASSPTGRKIVFEDDPKPKGETLPDGRFDGDGEWSYDNVAKAVHEGDPVTHNKLAMWCLYCGPVTVRGFADKTDEVCGRPSFKLRARITDLRQIPETPPICTNEDADPTEWYIPKAETDQ